MTFRDWSTSDPVELKRQLERYEREMDDRVGRLEFGVVGLTFGERNSDTVAPGQYVEVTTAQDHTVKLRKPSRGEVWAQAVVRKRSASGTTTVQAVGCSLDGTRDGTATATSETLMRFQAIPDGAGGAEWVSL